jgi:hypothetical protein
MAIGVDHLGAQIQCPHCLSVVQTVAPPPAANAEESPHESIFSDHDHSDSILGDAPAPRVEMPSPMPNVEMAASELHVESAPAPSSTQLPRHQPRPIYDKGILSITLLIFLVPYAIFTTGVILYLLLSGTSRSDPYEYLRDPVPESKKGGPRRARAQPAHNLPLESQLRTRIGAPIQAGDLLVTFDRVRLTEHGDLQLVLRAKNLSTNTAFEPINEAFVKVNWSRKDEKPYTFLESQSQSVDHLYGAYLSFHKDRLGLDEASSTAVLDPRKETTIVLTTETAYREKHVANVVNSNDEYLWRVRVRRGFVNVDGRDVSATMVIGVDFSSSEIERPKT